jgi:hypothetical protein
MSASTTGATARPPSWMLWLMVAVHRCRRTGPSRRGPRRGRRNRDAAVGCFFYTQTTSPVRLAIEAGTRWGSPQLACRFSLTGTPGDCRGNPMLSLSQTFSFLNESPDEWCNIREHTRNEYVAVGSNGNILRWGWTFFAHRRSRSAGQRKQAKPSFFVSLLRKRSVS